MYDERSIAWRQRDSAAAERTMHMNRLQLQLFSLWWSCYGAMSWTCQAGITVSAVLQGSQSPSIVKLTSLSHSPLASSDGHSTAKAAHKHA